MPDAHWVRYKSVRGQELPQEIDHAGRPYRLARVLKRDFYAITGLFEAADRAHEPGQLLVKTYHTDPLGLLPLGWLGRALCRREVHYLRRLDGIDGIPRLRGLHGPAGLVREFVPGCNLREYTQAARPDAAFFPRLAAILDAVHARGVAHNDLSKPENVLVRPDGSPVLIDFQIALEPPLARWPLVGRLTRAWVRYQQRVDRYHLTKLHRRRRPEDFTPHQLEAARRKGALLRAHALVRRPYRGVRHAVLNRFFLHDDASRKDAA